MPAQNKTKTKFSSKYEITETLYNVISGDAGIERDWELFNSLFTPDAKLIPIQVNKEGEERAQYVSPQGYIDLSGMWLTENGYSEKESFIKEDCFANICHLFSTYEAFKTSKVEEPSMRGIDSI